MKIILIVSILLIVCSIFYYYVIFLPQKEVSRLEQIKEEESYRREQERIELEREHTEQRIEENQKLLQQQFLDDCLSQVNSEYADIFNRLIEACNDNLDTYNCGISADRLIKEEIKDAKDECYRKYSQE